MQHYLRCYKKPNRTMIRSIPEADADLAVRIKSPPPDICRQEEALLISDYAEG